MEINSLRINLSTITDIVFFFLEPSIDLVDVPLTMHDTLLTTRGRRGFNVFLFFMV